MATIEPVNGLFLYCRPGFEAPCAREATRWVRARGADLVCRAPARAGYVLAEARSDAAVAVPGPRDLVFARQAFRAVARVTAEPVDAACLVRAARPTAGAGWWVGAPDSDAGRPLWPRAAALARELGAGAPGRGRFHAALLGEGGAVVGVGDPRLDGPWPMGIPRLRLPAGAPSRSARKLEEALLVLLDPRERDRYLKPGATAVDLGAAPGGWSWVLARRGVVVTAVDNGPLAPAALETGLVDPVRADGFTFRPRRPVDWLVCDMVAPPARVAKLVGVWLGTGRCSRALWNWKLPGRDPLAELGRARAALERELARNGVAAAVRVKHLYHDRAEVTAYAERRGPARKPAPRNRRRRR